MHSNRYRVQCIQYRVQCIKGCTRIAVDCMRENVSVETAHSTQHTAHYLVDILETRAAINQSVTSPAGLRLGHALCIHIHHVCGEDEVVCTRPRGTPLRTCPQSICVRHIELPLVHSGAREVLALLSLLGSAVGG
jgi:hypothetical protein